VPLAMALACHVAGRRSRSGYDSLDKACEGFLGGGRRARR